MQKYMNFYNLLFYLFEHFEQKKHLPKLEQINLLKVQGDLNSKMPHRIHCFSLSSAK